MEAKDEEFAVGNLGKEACIVFAPVINLCM